MRIRCLQHLPGRTSTSIESRSSLGRRHREAFTVSASLHPAQWRFITQLLVPADKPVGDRLVIKPLAQLLDHCPHIAADAAAVELKRKVDLLQPGSSDPEQVRPLNYLDRSNASALGSLRPREKVSKENTF